jgi:hypothetical protein
MAKKKTTKRAAKPKDQPTKTQEAKNEEAAAAEGVGDEGADGQDAAGGNPPPAAGELSGNGEDVSVDGPDVCPETSEGEDTGKGHEGGDAHEAADSAGLSSEQSSEPEISADPPAWLKPVAGHDGLKRGQFVCQFVKRYPGQAWQGPFIHNARSYDTLDAAERVASDLEAALGGARLQVKTHCCLVQELPEAEAEVVE